MHAFSPEDKYDGIFATYVDNILRIEVDDAYCKEMFKLIRHDDAPERDFRITLNSSVKATYSFKYKRLISWDTGFVAQMSNGDLVV